MELQEAVLDKEAFREETQEPEAKSIQPGGAKPRDTRDSSGTVSASSATPSWFWSIDDKPS